MDSRKFSNSCCSNDCTTNLPTKFIFKRKSTMLTTKCTSLLFLGRSVYQSKSKIRHSSKLTHSNKVEYLAILDPRQRSTLSVVDARPFLLEWLCNHPVLRSEFPKPNSSGVKLKIKKELIRDPALKGFTSAQVGHSVNIAIA